MVGEWKKVSMKDNLEILTGYAFSSKNFNEEEGIPLIRIRDLETHNPVTLYKGDYDDKYIINKGDILVGMDGEFNIVRWKGPKALLNQRVAKINSKNPNIISEDFIFYRLQGELREIEALTPATTVKHLSKKDIEDLNLLLPPLGEQSKIASILSSVDEAIEKTEAIIEQTEKVKKGLMQQLLTKGIGHTKFKKTEIGEIPEGWEVKQLAEVCVVNPTYRIERGTICSYVEMGAVSENSPHISYFGKREAGQGGGSRFKENDVLFARITPCTENGKTALVPKLESEVGLGSTEFIVLSPLKQILDPKFLYYFVKSDRVRNYAISRMTGTTGRQRVPKEVFEQELMIALPPIDEQKKIGEILYNYDKKIDHEKRWKNQLQTIKKGLMQVLLTGKVRVKVDNEVMSQ